MSDARLEHIRSAAEVAQAQAQAQAPPAPESKPDGAASPGPPILQGVDLVAGVVLSNVAAAPMTTDELAGMRRIAMRAMKRMFADLAAQLTGEPKKRLGRPPGRPKGRPKAKRRPGRPKGSGPSLTASGKRRGRPPKVRPAENVSPLEASPSAQTTIPFTVPEGADFTTPPADSSPA